MNPRIPVAHRLPTNVGIFIAALIASGILIGVLIAAAYWFGVSDQYRDTFRRDLTRGLNPLHK